MRYKGGAAIIAKTVTVDGEQYISIPDLKQIIKDRNEFVTGGHKGGQFDAYNLALNSINKTLEDYEQEGAKS